MSTGRNLQDFFLDPYEGFRRVKDGHFAFYSEESAANEVIPKLFQPHEICGIREIAYRSNFPVGVMVKRSSPLRERLLLNWIRIDEIGIAHKILSHFNGIKPVCSTKGHFESIRFEYVAPIFLFLFSIYICSFCIFLLELIVSKLK